MTYLNEKRIHSTECMLNYSKMCIWWRQKRRSRLQVEGGDSVNAVIFLWGTEIKEMTQTYVLHMPCQIKCADVAYSEFTV